jgi:hypothetical protein
MSLPPGSPPTAPPVTEPPPPLGSWTKFYLLVAVIHVAVVTALVLFSNAYRVLPGGR